MIQFLLSFFLLHFLWAGDKIKNGGDVVVCPTPQGKSYEVLDLVEARLTGQWDETESLTPTPGEILSRLRKFSPKRADIYQKRWESFFQETRILTGVNFTDLSDEGGKIFPQHCELKQAVLQMTRPSSNQARYFINGDVWAQLSESQKSALIFHELIYRELLEQDARLQDSTGVRLFNGFLHAPQFDQFHIQDFIQALQRSHFQTAEYRGFQVDLSNNQKVTYYDSQHILSASLGSELVVQNEFQTTIHCTKKEGVIRAFFAKSDASVRLISDCAMNVDLQKNNHFLWALADVVNLASSQQIESLQLVNPELKQGIYSLNIENENGHLVKTGEFKIEFWPSGQVRKVGTWTSPLERQRSHIKKGAQFLSLEQLKASTICFPEGQSQMEICSNINF